MVTALAREEYVPDKKIVDVEDPPPPIARSRVPTEELIVHVRQDGKWHRAHPSKPRTACGIRWTDWGHENRRSGRAVLNPLADCACWTPAEREEADEAERVAPFAIPIVTDEEP